MPSWISSKCEAISRHLFRPSTFKFPLKFWKWWDIPSFEWLKTLYMMQKHCILYLVDTLLTNQCIFIGKLLFKEKIIGRWRGPKRGKFRLLGGRWIFRREMGSKRGSLPSLKSMYARMSSGGVVVQLMLAEQRGQGFDFQVSPPRFKRLAISCFKAK